jgi:uncharacterized protein (UPF0335 family)
MDGMDTGGMVNSDALRGYVTRIVSLHDDRDELNGDLREVYKEAKDGGFDTTTLREIVREQRMESEARHSRYALLDSYRHALGMLADTPLGDSAMDRAEREQPTVQRPRPFAEQPIKRGRGRPRKPRPMDFLPDDGPEADPGMVG